MTGKLIESLKSEDRMVRRKAAIALGKSGTALAVDALIAALRDCDGRVAEEAAEALGKIGDPRAVPALVDTLYHKNASMRATDAIASLENLLLRGKYWHSTSALEMIKLARPVDSKPPNSAMLFRIFSA